MSELARTTPVEIEAGPVGGELAGAGRLLSDIDADPVSDYLNRLKSPESRRTMRKGLTNLARILTGPWPPAAGQRPRELGPPSVAPEALAWHRLTPSDVA